MKDLFGQAIFDYYTKNNSENLVTSTNISEDDEMDIAYLFRDYKNMPKIEQKALSFCKGKVLDVGCGAGCHSLYIKEKLKLDVKPIDISAKAIETCQLQGLKNAEKIHLLEFKDQKFDTILLLMNGTGIFEKLENLSQYLLHLKSLLNENGQILIDGSDIIYMYDEDEDGGKWIPSDGYYGQLTFTLTYKGKTEEPFSWLYLDYNTLQNACWANVLNCELVLEGEHFDYLARITIA